MPTPSITGTVSYTHLDVYKRQGSGITLTIDGPVVAPPSQIFNPAQNALPGYVPVAFGPTYQRLNVKWFGAVGDGTTPDDVAFNNALAALNKMGAAIFELPKPSIPSYAPYNLSLIHI